jgi:DNA-binding response OmpR family regulator
MRGMTRTAVLVVEDDRQLAGLLQQLLTDAGFDVQTAADGQTALHLALTRTYDVLLVDRGLPVLEGVELLRRLRDKGVATPALVLTARGTLEDRVEGLDAGADDYLVKPFEVPELLARLRALTRRHVDRATSLPLGRRRLDEATRSVVGGDEVSIELSNREFALAWLLASRPSRTFTREELLDAVFAGADNPGAVDTYVHYLRRKLGRDAVRTVHGLGYRWGEA